jgi:(5-formylfuran-3-yl)methyl phosphate synthase
MMKLLVSVRNPHEALLAAAGGADFIDLKEPRLGALGGLPLATIRRCVAALRGFSLPISATIGDLPMQAHDEIAAHVQDVADCGVDFVKVGIEREPCAHDVLAMLAACGRPVVPVLIADRGLDAALVSHAAGLGFAGLMVDTADKGAGSLFDCAPISALRQFIDSARAASLMCGLAGALRIEHLPQLAALAPDFAGFRTAVCGGDRSGMLDPQRLFALRQATLGCPKGTEAPSGGSERRELGGSYAASGGREAPISSERTESSALL